VLKDVADKAGLSRNRAHLRDQCRAGAAASNADRHTRNAVSDAIAS
jgi:hypothetical protein